MPWKTGNKASSKELTAEASAWHTILERDTFINTSLKWEII